MNLLLLAIVLTVAIFTSGCYVSGIWSATNNELIQEWAAANGLRILHVATPLWIWSMPFAWMFTNRRYQPVYRLSVLDESSHRIRNCWIRTGKSAMGILGDDNDGDVDVKWDDDK